MITKAARQEQKPSVLFSMPDLETNVGSSITELNIYKRDLDFNKIDYLIFSSYTCLSLASGDCYLKLDIAGVNKANHHINISTTPQNNYTRIDCTSITGTQTVEIYHSVDSAGDMEIHGVYLGVVDA